MTVVVIVVAVAAVLMSTTSTRTALYRHTSTPALRKVHHHGRCFGIATLKTSTTLEWGFRRRFVPTRIPVLHTKADLLSRIHTIGSRWDSRRRAVVTENVHIHGMLMGMDIVPLLLLSQHELLVLFQQELLALQFGQKS